MNPKAPLPQTLMQVNGSHKVIGHLTLHFVIWEFPEIRGTLFGGGGPYNKDPTINYLGYYARVPHSRKLPCLYTSMINCITTHDVIIPMTLYREPSISQDVA